MYTLPANSELVRNLAAGELGGEFNHLAVLWSRLLKGAAPGRPAGCP